VGGTSDANGCAAASVVNVYAGRLAPRRTTAAITRRPALQQSVTGVTLHIAGMAAANVAGTVATAAAWAADVSLRVPTGGSSSRCRA
jgi:hypothetical protein